VLSIMHDCTDIFPELNPLQLYMPRIGKINPIKSNIIRTIVFFDIESFSIRLVSRFAHNVSI